MLNIEVIDCRELDVDGYFKSISKEMRLIGKMSTIKNILYELKYRKYYILSKNKPFKLDNIELELSLIDKIISILEEIKSYSKTM